jgi:hypothetical protein
MAIVTSWKSLGDDSWCSMLIISRVPYYFILLIGFLLSLDICNELLFNLLKLLHVHRNCLLKHYRSLGRTASASTRKRVNKETSYYSSRQAFGNSFNGLVPSLAYLCRTDVCWLRLAPALSPQVFRHVFFIILAYLFIPKHRIIPAELCNLILNLTSAVEYKAERLSWAKAVT